MKKLICKIFGHKYTLLRRISPTIRELKCTRCNSEFGMNDELMAVLPMDFDLKHAHDILHKS